MPAITEYAPSVYTFPDRTALGIAAARRAAEVLRARLSEEDRAFIMLAAAPSQQATLEALSREPGIDWDRVTAFHMDDYVGLPHDAPQGFGNWLERQFIQAVPGVAFERIGTSGEPEIEARRYAERMGDAPFDLVLLGLGVNGHLAFNDPPADFAHPEGADVVILDDVSRRQQVDEGHFATFEDVPDRAITVTIPRLLNAREIIASVPGTEKRQAVEDVLTTDIDPLRPGTALRTHLNVGIYLDAESTPEGARR